jgi:hypothetical protein
MVDFDVSGSQRRPSLGASVHSLRRGQRASRDHIPRANEESDG